MPLRSPERDVVETAEEAAAIATVRIEAPDACPRYLARVIRGLTHRPSPLFVQARLTACGMRPIDAVVDATNYTMLELGQPLHGFDLSLLSGPGIVVRRAVRGERITTLDDVDREVSPEDLLICDHERPVAIAGIMGGAAAEVSLPRPVTSCSRARTSRAAACSCRDDGWTCIPRRHTASSAAPTRRDWKRQRTDAPG